MQAVILAAGMGSRLNKLTGGASKALAEIGGRPLILHTLEALADHGVGPVLVVLGHDADKLQAVIGDRAETILNERFIETNSLYSLWLARDWIKGEFLLLNCDLFFDPRILDRLLEEPGNVLAYDSTSSRGREQTKVAIKQRRVVDIGKDLPAASARGESLGMLKFDRDGARAMLQTADHLIRVEKLEQSWVIEATRAVCSQVPLYGVNVAGSAWTEIDYPYDLDVARREVWPVIWKGRWRRQVYWRRSRWAALGAAALALAVSGWVANSRLGPGSFQWETVYATGADSVRILRAGEKSQRWHAIGVDSAATATVSGSRAMIETRMLLPGGSRGAVHFVVAVTLDGKDYDWKLLTAKRDTTVAFPGHIVGDRDRIEIPLAPGAPHTVSVRLIASQGGRLLVRIRQAEARED